MSRDPSAAAPCWAPAPPWSAGGWRRRARRRKRASHRRRLHYDPAGHPLPRLAPALMQVADPGRGFYGGDWPFTPMPIVARVAGEIDRTALFDEAARGRILLDNALALFPRLRG